MSGEGRPDSPDAERRPRQSPLSPHWRYVATMRPRVRAQARIHRHVLRGKVWYILQDSVNNRFHRLTPALYRLVAQMDGTRTVEQIWNSAVAHEQEDCPTQQEVIQLLGRLHSADVLRGQLSPDLDEISRRARFLARRNRLSRVRSPLAIRIPLLDPDRFLSATVFLVKPLLSVVGMIAWLGFVAWGISLAVVHWDELTRDIADRVLSADNLLLLWILFPLVKVVHELGHGYAAKRWGGEVHEMGIMFLVFVPVPYVEASSATAFPSRWQRVAVSAGGMLAEIPLAVLALWAWTEVEAGLVRSAMYNVILIAGVSTVLFNGNPLLRFDGYYILMDLLEMPNMGPRANRYVGYLLQRYAFGAAQAHNPADAPQERKILFVYSIASFIYRLFVMTAIILVVASKFFTIGILLAIWAAFQMFALPIAKLVWHLFTAPVLRGHRTRAVGLSGLTGIALAGFLLFVPLPLATIAEGVIIAPEHTAVRAGASGIVLDVRVEAGEPVRAGQTLLTMESPLLGAEISVLEAQRTELEALLRAALSDPASARLFRAELEHVGARLARAHERFGAQSLKAERDGFFLVQLTDELIGRQIERGQSPGFVSDLRDPIIEVALPAANIDLIRSRLRNARARPVWNLALVEDAEVLTVEPAATRVLRRRALSVQGGGRLSLAPTANGEQKTLEDVFYIRLAVPPGWLLRRVGDRVYVRFDLGTEPPAYQIYRQLRRMFLKRFDV